MEAHIASNENQAIIDVVTGLAKVQKIDGLPDGHVAFALPNGFELQDFTEEIDRRTDERAPGPRRIKGTEVAETLDGFTELVRRHSTRNTAIFARGGNEPKLLAVIDYHAASTDVAPTESTEAKPSAVGAVPAWRDHRVSYAFPFTPSFVKWTGLGFQPKNVFLQFVRDNAIDMVAPDEVEALPGSVTRTIFEAVLRAQGKPRAEREAAPLEKLFGSPSALLNGAERLAAISSKSFEETDNRLGGISVKYSKEDKVTNTEQLLEFYLVELEVFPGAEKTILPMRLKTSVRDGALYLALEVLGVKEMIEKAFSEAVRQVEGHTARPVYRAALAG